MNQNKQIDEAYKEALEIIRVYASKKIIKWEYNDNGTKSLKGPGLLCPSGEIARNFLKKHKEKIC